MIENDELRLRPFTEKDVPLNVKWINDPDVHRYLQYDIPLTEENTRRGFEQMKNQKDRCDLVIEHPLEIPIGLIGLSDIDEEQKTANFYVAIGEKEYWGKGIASAATKLLCDWAFNTFALEKIKAILHIENKPAIAMLERVGFCTEGPFRQCGLFKKKRKDSISMVLSKTH